LSSFSKNQQYLAFVRPIVPRMRLESQFISGRIDFEKLERAIEQELAEPTTCAPWRRSEIEQTGCSDGARMAALEFFWGTSSRIPT
jgi:hypothetical protein